MRIIYVAKHGSGGNNDEDAISHSLRELGHEVVCIPECEGKQALSKRGDLLLFHKWDDFHIMHKIKMKKVFWYFDLVEYPDPTLERRNMIRRTWMHNAIARVDLGFCTDGDWIRTADNPKLIRLLQGADQRFTWPADFYYAKPIDIMFSGIRKGGMGRMSFVDEMRARYGSKFSQVERCFGRFLANNISLCKIIVAPDHPITDHYWSNRVYLTLGYGGFMLHPYCETLEEHYEDRKEIVYYKNREDLHEQIEYYLDRPKDRTAIQMAAQKRTLAEHTYLHRCRTLIETVKERLL